MSRGLLLVDLQHGFLREAGLEPAAGELLRRVESLLAGFREQGLAVLHCRTIVAPGEEPMPHRGAEWMRAGGADAATPEAVGPLPGEPSFEKRFYDAFSAAGLEQSLRSAGIEELVIAGVHEHACVRETALSAYERGLSVVIAADAVGSSRPMQGALERRWLRARAATYATVGELLAGRPPEAAPTGLEAITDRARVARSDARPTEITAALIGASGRLRAGGERLARRITETTGKPIRLAEREIDRAVRLLDIAGHLAVPTDARNAEAVARRRPLGTVALITPHNNPVAIGAGKLGPALALGNAVIWKPDPRGAELARELVALLAGAGLPAGLLTLLEGGARAGEELLAHPGVDAATITGSSASGFAAQAICGERRIPLQAELGGNNGAIVCGDADLDDAAEAVARSAFEAAGQRCTATRRLIVEASAEREMLERLGTAVRRLGQGSPLDQRTEVGALIDAEAVDRIRATVERAAREGATIEPLTDEPRPAAADPFAGRYLAPTLVRDAEPDAEIIQRESFGPLLAVQRADDFEQALELLNRVPEGLVCSLFSTAAERRERFCAEAQAGVLKLDRGTAEVGVETPFGGWKRSGVGPPEHGEGNVEFYTRAQAVYD